jgi:hypothetical protein
VTFLPAQIQGQWFYLYLILDLYSRKVVGFEVHGSDSADHAAHLAKRTALAEGLHGMTAKPVLHGDNGAKLKATTVLAMLYWLGIKPSYSRPRVSDDNAFAEALFRTAKYRPEFPTKGFTDLDAARQWAERFVHWYNHEHRHSGIDTTSPRRNAMPGRITRCWPVVMNSTSRHARPTHGAGVVRPATGRHPARSPSTRNGMPWSSWSSLKTRFPVRSASLLSYPDLEPPWPRRATEGKRGAEPPGATRSARAWRGRRAPDLVWGF